MELLRFTHLYDNVWAAFRGRKERFFDRRIILPNGFQPEGGKVYECDVDITQGDFVYNEERFNLCFATLAGAASVIDVIDHKYPPSEKRKEYKLDSPLAVALEKAGLAKKVT